MDVADRIAVMNEGPLSRSGAPRELYEGPANGFVMSFLGRVARLGETLVRFARPPRQRRATRV